MARTDLPAEEDRDEIIRVRGFLTPEDALYFREEEGIEVNDRFIRD